MAHDGYMQFRLAGSLQGHDGSITQIATHPIYKNLLISSSKDKKILVWNLNLDTDGFVLRGKPIKSLHGHTNAVSDVVLSSDGQYALSSSWDKTLRLWDLNSETSVHQFISHTKAVSSVAFYPDNRQIISGSCDKTIKIWNTLAQCQHTIDQKTTGNEAHNDWVSAVRFSPSSKDPVIVSASWAIKIWDPTSFCLKSSHVGHLGYINTVAIAPDGSLCASGGEDGHAMLWDMSKQKQLCKLYGGNDAINTVVFSPNRYWMCAAVGPAIKVWDLKCKTVLDELILDKMYTPNMKWLPHCTSLAWSSDGKNLFAGYTDNIIRIWNLCELDGDGKLRTQQASATSNIIENEKSSLIGDKYKLVRKIGSGSFGAVHLATNTQSGEQVAVKLEPIKARNPKLYCESIAYEVLQGSDGIPRIYYYGTDGDFCCLVMDLLGPSLENLFGYCNRRFTMKTVLMLADEMIKRIECVHSHGFIHRDVKPDNFLMGNGSHRKKLFIVDFGLATRYQEPQTQDHIPFRSHGSSKLIGTARYASLNAHLGLVQSRRDDLESLGYVLIYFLRGSLPWQGMKARNMKQKDEKISEKKNSISVEELCKGFPSEFSTYLDYCRKLRFEEEPSYVFLRQLFRLRFYSMQLEYDYNYDWIPKQDKWN